MKPVLGMPQTSYDEVVNKKHIHSIGKKINNMKPLKRRKHY